MILTRVKIEMLLKNIITMKENHRLKIQAIKSIFVEGNNVSGHNQELTKVTGITSDSKNSSGEK